MGMTSSELYHKKSASSNVDLKSFVKVTSRKSFKIKDKYEPYSNNLKRDSDSNIYSSV
jgi:hypothetical protein